MLFGEDSGEFVPQTEGGPACDPSETYPRSGAGLRQFSTEVVDGRLLINLRDREVTTTEG